MKNLRSLNRIARAIVITLGLIGPAMAQERIQISSDWGTVTAELVDNDASRSLLRMLPVTIDMQDHLRQEKTGNLPSPLAGGRTAVRFLIRYTRTLELQSFRDLLPQRPRPSARNHFARPRSRRRFDL